MDNVKLYLAEDHMMETERLKLRPITLADAEDMYEYASKEDNTYFVFPRHTSIDDTRHSIATYFMADPLGKFGIELKENNKLIGTADIRVDMTKFKAEVGYVLNQTYSNQGYATEAVKKLVEFAFETLELEKVIATCDARNITSEALMKRLGMTKEGHARKHELWKKGEWVDMLYYGLLKEEYIEQKNSSK